MKSTSFHNVPGGKLYHLFQIQSQHPLRMYHQEILGEVDSYPRHLYHSMNQGGQSKGAITTDNSKPLPL